MGTRRPYALVDTTPAKTILVYRNGDQFYVGRKFVFTRRRVPSFESLLEQLTEQVDVPFGVRRLYTPMRGHSVRGLDAVQAGGKYVAAGRERFKKLDYIHIVPRKPPKMRKLKEIKPVVHCAINVPSRWQTQNRTSRYINVFTNGRLFIPPIKIIIPKFSLSDWNSVLAVIGEKVFPLGGVRKLFTMDGHLLDDSKDLQDNYFYVAAGLETFKSVPYWKSSRVPSEIQQRFGDKNKYSQTKKKVEPKGKEPLRNDSVPPKSQDSVYYAKEKKNTKTAVGPLVQGGAEGDVYKAQTPAKEVQEALEVREDPEMKVEVPVDEAPAEIVKEIDEIGGNNFDMESRVGDHSSMSFKERFPLRNFRKRKASLKSLSKNKEVVPTPEKEQHAIVEEKNIPALPETQVETEIQRQPSMGRESQEESSTTQDQKPEQQESSAQLSLGVSSPEQKSKQQESLGQSSLELLLLEKQLEQQKSPGQSSLELPSSEQQLEQESPGHSSLGPSSPEQQLEQSLILAPPEQQLEQRKSSKESSLGPFLEQLPEQ